MFIPRILDAWQTWGTPALVLHVPPRSVTVRPAETSESNIWGVFFFAFEGMALHGIINSLAAAAAAAATHLPTGLACRAGVSEYT